WSREAAMDAADPSCRHEADPGDAADSEGAADGRRADGALDRRGRQVPWPGLARLGREAGELVLGQSDPHAAVEDADRRGQGADGPDPLLRREVDLDSDPGREPVRDDRGLERDDRPPSRDRLLNLARDLDHGIAPSFATERAAASTASSGP